MAIYYIAQGAILNVLQWPTMRKNLKKNIYIYSWLDIRLLFWAPKSLQMVTAAMKLKDAYSLEGKLWPI